MPQQSGGMNSGSGKGGYGGAASSDYSRSVQKRQHSPPNRRPSPPRGDRGGGVRMDRDRRDRDRREEVRRTLF